MLKITKVGGGNRGGWGKRVGGGGGGETVTRMQNKLIKKRITKNNSKPYQLSSAVPCSRPNTEKRKCQKKVRVKTGRLVPWTPRRKGSDKVIRYGVPSARPATCREENKATPKSVI